MRFIAEDISRDDILLGEFDFALFASGYEERCTYVPGLVESLSIKHVSVLGFSDFSDAESRRMNDDYFANTWNASPIVADSANDRLVYSLLNQHLLSESSIRILIDYTAMSRVWWSAVLNWVKYAASGREVVIDFVYCPGIYEPDISPSRIDDIVALPGCEGGSIGRGDTIAIVGLGFSGVVPRCVLEYLEPNKVYAYLASPAAFPHYVERVQSNNATLLQDAVAVLESPLGSVEETVRMLKELVLPLIDANDVILVPMGPKPHVLASVLVALEYQLLTCLRVSLTRDTPIKVQSSGQFICTRVRCVPNIAEPVRDGE